jgi:Spy/CpxP family protein refolding chaperone
MKSRMMAVVFMSSALMLSSLSAAARRNDSLLQKPFQKMIIELNLTQEQQVKLRAQHKQMLEEGKVIFEEMKKVREKVREELLKDKPSKSTLDDYASQLAGLHKQLIQKHHEHLLQTKAILSPEQFSKLLNHEGKGFGQPGDRPFFQKKGKHGPADDMDDM